MSFNLAELTQKFRAVWPLLDERTRRLLAANEAIGLGYGGVSVVHRACGLSRKAIDKGIREIQEGDGPGEGHVRRAGQRFFRTGKLDISSIGIGTHRCALLNRSN
jgi:hypothetical protein